MLVLKNVLHFAELQAAIGPKVHFRVLHIEARAFLFGVEIFIETHVAVVPRRAGRSHAHPFVFDVALLVLDRKSTRLNSSHL